MSYQRAEDVRPRTALTKSIELSCSFLHESSVGTAFPQVGRWTSHLVEHVPSTKLIHVEAPLGLSSEAVITELALRLSGDNTPAPFLNAPTGDLQVRKVPA